MKQTSTIEGSVSVLARVRAKKKGNNLDHEIDRSVAKQARNKCWECVVYLYKMNRE
jgi:hypothetical protein